MPKKNASISVYELYLGSFRHGEDGKESLSYRELAPLCCRICKENGLYTCGADAGDGASPGCILGLSGDWLLCTDRATEHRMTSGILWIRFIRRASV